MGDMNPKTLLIPAGLLSGFGTRAVNAQDGLHLAYSRDTLHWSPQKFIPVMAKEKKARNCWAPSASFTGDYRAEGPTAIRSGDRWILYFDKYPTGKMGAVESSDLLLWKDISDQVSFPEGTRHGAVFSVTQKEFEGWLPMSEPAEF